MFTKANSTTRPRLAGRPRITQPGRSRLEPVPSRPRATNARGASGVDLHRKAQEELERLLQRLGRAPEAARSTRPISDRVQPTRTERARTTMRNEPTSTQTQTAADTSASRVPQGHPQAIGPDGQASAV